MAWISTYCRYGKRLFSLLIALAVFNTSFSQTIFQPTDAPVMPLANDGQPIGFGVKFRSTSDGFINAIRFYKGMGTTGTHTGQLWTSTGMLLNSVVFINETASGWQEVLFATPVAITAGVTYIASCHSNSGDYAFTNPFFTQAVVNGPLRGLASGEDGPNGIYIYSQNPAFPTNNFQTVNYWVDVVFSTGPDHNPPVISSVSPLNAATGIGTNATVRAVFNEPIDPSTVSNSTFELRSASGSLVTASVSYIASNNTAILTPSSSLSTSTTYTAKITGGASGVKDLAGNALADDYAWTFTTGAFVAPEDGNGGPILVISNTTNPFSRYAVEILRAEGLNEFDAKDISVVTAPDINKYDVVILGEMQVTPAQVTMLSDWVNAGGVLIAFKPSDLLTPLLGISNANGQLADKYLLVNTSSGPGAGIVNETIQFHGNANLHTLNGATSLATLYSTANTPTANPAVTTLNVGTNGGKAIAFTYDLARSIVYTRQGNPAWAGQERDGQTPIRSDDLFFGLPPNTGADWIDFNKVAIPQADEQQRFLANIIIQNNLHHKPLPRLWYLPRGLKAAVVMTGDDHANNGTEGRFNHYKTLGPNSPEQVADWYAVRGTSYIYPNTPIPAAEAAALEADGFEIALHPSTGCTNYTQSSLDNAISTQLVSLAAALPGISAPVTNRTHCLVWSDWASHAKVEANRGMRLDVNYYYWPGTWIQNRPGMFTGSGMPMRFADTDGSLIDCYQVTTQMTDESGITDYASFSEQLFDKALGPEGYYGTFCANMHTDSANHIGSSTIIASALARKIPVISSKQLLTWLDGRNNSFFDSITWNNSQLHFKVTAAPGTRNLNGMLPRYVGTDKLVSIERNGVSIGFGAELIKGIEYVFFNVDAGTNTYVAKYASAPLVVVHPASLTVCAGQTVSFNSEATGNPSPTIQWQLSENGTSWININGATTATISFVAATSDNNKQYRAVWTNSSGTVNSNPAVLAVKPTPVLSSTLNPPAIISGTLFSYTPTSTINGTSFAWHRELINGISNPPANGTGSISEVLINTTNESIVVKYTYKLAANGCFNTQYVLVKVEPAPEGCRFNTSITANFNSISIPAGRHIWFSSVFKAVNLGSAPVNFYVTNSRITYTLNNQLTTLEVPDAHIRFAPGVSASTKFINGIWKTEVPLNYGGNAFLTGLSNYVTRNLPGGIRNVTWSADVESDKQNIIFTWKWTAGVYNSFAGHAGLNVKPIDGLLNILSPLLNLANAGTPLNYTLSIVPGAMGAGLLNITNTYSAAKTETCDDTPATPAGLLTKQASNSSGQPQSREPLPGQRFDVRVLPNPANAYFNLVINSSSTDPAIVIVTDMFGRVIEKQERANASGGLKIGYGWTAGTYFAEVIQGNERRIVKMIKIN